MNYCAKSDPQATRLVYILTTFNHVIVSRAPGAPLVRDPIVVHTPVPNTPTGAMSNSSNDPIANFFLAHSNTAVPAGGYGQSASQHSSQSVPDLVRRNSANVAPGGPSPSPGMMPATAATPTTSAGGGDLMSDAEWFHFDSLWENWAPPAAAGSAATGATTTGMTDPALFNDSTLNNFDVPVTAGTFATPPIAGAPQADMRYTGSGGGMQVPLYPMMRFTD